MAGPKKQITEKDMKDIDFSVIDPELEKQQKSEYLESIRKEFIGDGNDNLKHLGFMDSDEEIDFSNFKKK